MAIADAAGIGVVEDAAQAQGAKRLGRDGGQLRPRCGDQLLPRQEPRGLRRRRGGADRTPTRSHGRSASWPTTAARCATSTSSRASTPASTRCRRSCCWRSSTHLAAWNEARRAAAARYDELLDEVDGVGAPGDLAGNEHVWHLYAVRVADRDEVAQRMQSNGIGAGIHYPVPVHLQEAFRHLGYSRGDFPVAEAAAAEILSLPMFPGITRSQQERVVEELAKALNK